MKESVTYQAILEEGAAIGEVRGEAKGEVNEARRILRLLGTDWFGKPSGRVRAALDRLADVKQIEQLTLRMKQVSSWEELLRLPGPRRRSPRKKSS